MTEKRFKSESFKFSDFIVDLNSAISKGANITKYKSYDTSTKEKCDELTDLLNNLIEENEQLKSANMEMEDYLGRLEVENGRMKGAFKRKFDYDIEDVVDEICDEDGDGE